VSASVTVDVRRTNMLRILADLRSHGLLSRSDLARLTGLAVPTVHRLVSDLTEAGLVLEDEPALDESRLGRPPSVYRFHSSAGCLAGLDIGNQSTRAVIASLSGHPLKTVTVPTGSLADDLGGGLAALIAELLDHIGASEAQLAGVGIGVSAVVDPASGELRDPPHYRQWHRLQLGTVMADRLGCAIEVRQDDHLAAFAEASATGTFPGAQSLAVLAVGQGIGVGLALNSVPISGQNGRFGRIASFPVTPPRGIRLTGRTLGDCLTAPGLVTQYEARGGTEAVHDGKSLFDAARNGDPTARTVVAWAAREIATVATMLHTIFDPEGFVLGGGLAKGFDLLEPDLIRHTGETGPVIRPSVLGEQAVLSGALLTAQTRVEPWLSARLGS
jgi:glucokinase